MPFGDSITGGALGGPNSNLYGRGGYRYFLERFLEASEGTTAFVFDGSLTVQGGTMASFAGQWFAAEKPLNHPVHSGYSGASIQDLKGYVESDTIPVDGSDVILLMVGTNNIGYDLTTPATPGEIAGWKSAYEELLDAILSKSATTKVVMSTIPPVTDGANIGDAAANAARIEPFNTEVVAAVHADYAVAHPGRFKLVDAYSLLDPANASADASFATATNDYDFFTGLGDGVHPYNGGHRKMAEAFWEGYQRAKGAAEALVITPFDDPDGDGVAGGDICLLGDGTKRDGIATEVEDQPYVLASATADARAKYFIKLDLSGLPKQWDEARFNLVFWGAPAGTPSFGNCCDDQPSTTTLKLYGIADGEDGWTEDTVTWATAPGNDVAGDGVSGTFLGDLEIPAGTQTGAVISVATPELRDFINHARGSDGLVTFAVVGETQDPGFRVSFQDSDFRDYAPPFLQLVERGDVCRILPIGDSITSGALGGPNSPLHDRGGFRYFLERFLEGSEGSLGFTFEGSIENEPGTIAAFAGKWYSPTESLEKPLNHPKHSGYSGYLIEQIEALVVDGTIPVEESDIILLQIGTNNVGYGLSTPATGPEIAAWKAAYEDLLDAILAKSPSARVVMAKIPPVADGANLGNADANAARIEPFNAQVVAAVHADYSAAHPGRFILADNYSPLDPDNFGDDPGFATSNNSHDFFTGLGDGVHPYSGGHRKMAVNFWKGVQLARGYDSVEIVTPLDDRDSDGDSGADICVLGDGSVRDGEGTVVDNQPYVLASATGSLRAKYYLKLDLAGLATDWDEASLNLVFWGAPSGTPNFGNCCDDQPATTTLAVYGIADGGDGWAEDTVTWSTAPGNDTAGDGVTGTYLGDLVIPAGTQTGDVIRLESAALRDFVNLSRGADDLVTFAVVGTSQDPGFRTSFQDSDFLDYAPPFLQLARGSVPPVPTEVVITGSDLDMQAAPAPTVELTFLSSEHERYLVSASEDLETYDEVLVSEIPGATGAEETTVTLPMPVDRPQIFLRVEQH